MCLGEDPKTTGQPLKLRMEGDRKIICIDGITLPCDPSNENGLLVSNIYRVLCTKHLNKGLNTDEQFHIYIFKVSPPPGQSTPGYIFYPHKLSDTSGKEIVDKDLPPLIVEESQLREQDKKVFFYRIT